MKTNFYFVLLVCFSMLSISCDREELQNTTDNNTTDKDRTLSLTASMPEERMKEH